MVAIRSCTGRLHSGWNGSLGFHWYALFVNSIMRGNLFVNWVQGVIKSTDFQRFGQIVI